MSNVKRDTKRERIMTKIDIEKLAKVVLRKCDYLFIIFSFILKILRT